MSSDNTIPLEKAEGFNERNRMGDYQEVDNNQFQTTIPKQACDDRKIKSSPIPEVLHNCAPFIVKLFSLVNSEEYSHLIGWSEEHNGKAFIIKDSVKFADEVLPYHFKHSNISSFVRQLNIYGFHKLDSKDGICFKHDFFTREKPFLLERIKRKKNRKTQSINTTDSENEMCSVISLRMDMAKLEKDLLEMKHEIQFNNNRWLEVRGRLDQIDSFLSMLYQMSGGMGMLGNGMNMARRFDDPEDMRRRENQQH
ncbi:Heat stress transcription factor C-1 [Entamoeba marina]